MLYSQKAPPDLEAFEILRNIIEEFSCLIALEYLNNITPLRYIQQNIDLVSRACMPNYHTIE